MFQKSWIAIGAAADPMEMFMLTSTKADLMKDRPVRYLYRSGPQHPDQNVESERNIFLSCVVQSGLPKALV